MYVFIHTEKLAFYSCFIIQNQIVHGVKNQSETGKYNLLISFELARIKSRFLRDLLNINIL